MLVPLSWLRHYVDLELSTTDLCERLTLAGLEVTAVERVGDWWDPETITVGEVVAVSPHPDADRLVLVDINYGAEETLRVVTGAPNLFDYRDLDQPPPEKVAFARAGAMLVDAYSDKVPRPTKKLKPSKIRGVPSSGMVCSERELGLSEEHEGILLLPADAPVGMPLRDYLGDEIVEIELTPDMSRCLNMVGVAREVAALTGAALHLPADEWQPQGDDEAADYIDVRIEDPELCHRYTGIMVRDVTIGPSPKWMQDALLRAGLRPINNVVDITNYVMLEWGQPLHAFDYDILVERARRVGDQKPTIIVRRAAEGEEFTTLDDIERLLDNNMLMICDTAGSVAIAGVMGGQESEVRDETRNVLLEAATFEGINNRRTAAKLRLPSDASYRFARGIPASLNDLAARRAAMLMHAHAGGRIVPGIVDAYPVKQPQRVVYTTVTDVRRLLGIAVTQEQIISALQQLDFEVRVVENVAENAGEEATFALKRVGDEALIEAIAPWHRLDANIPADLTEEVARIIGYEAVETTLLDDPLPTQRRNVVLESEDRIRDLLVSAGLPEIINHPLTTPENHDRLHPGAKATGDADYVTLTNPLTPLRRSMRQSMIVSALENMARNMRFTNRLTTYEIGRVYLKGGASAHGDGLLPHEERRLCILMAGPRATGSFYADANDEEEMDFFDLKGVIESLLARLGFDPTTVAYRARPDADPFGPRCAEVVVGDVALGLAGELHPQVRTAFGLPALRVNIAELQIAPLVRPHWQLNPMAPISNYPPMVEDLAFEVAESITVHQVEAAIRNVGADILTAIELFDIYRGEQIAAGNKSLAFKLTYQSPKRAVNEKEIGNLRKRVIRAVEQAVGGVLRG